MQAESDIAFGRFRLDLTNECLWHGTQAISLRPKAFALLKLLLEHPGSLVTKQTAANPKNVPTDNVRCPCGKHVAGLNSNRVLEVANA
jgi:hypothetical protein